MKQHLKDTLQNFAEVRKSDTPEQFVVKSFYLLSGYSKLVSALAGAFFAPPQLLSSGTSNS